jgi:hypothetical protein
MKYLRRVIFVTSDAFTAASVRLYGGVPPWIVRPHASQLVSTSVMLPEMVNPASDGRGGQSEPAAIR